MNNSYYDILEINSTASVDEIKFAFRKLAFKYHPDKCSDKVLGEAKMKELNFVYSILSNPEKRKLYDDSIYTENFENESYDTNKYSFVFCENIEIEDSNNVISNIKVGDTIYYKIEIDKSIISWKYKKVQYFSLNIKEVFNQSQSDYFSKFPNIDKNRIPLFLAYFGKSTMIIYKDDFQNFWISSKSYKKIENKNGIITSIILSIFLVSLFGYFVMKFNISKERVNELNNTIKLNEKYNKEQEKYYEKKYFATKNEFTYILSDYYKPCLIDTTKISAEDVVLCNIPDSQSIVVGTIPNGSIVEILLYCEEKGAYKIKYKNLIGWVHYKDLSNPKCDE